MYTINWEMLACNLILKDFKILWLRDIAANTNFLLALIAIPLPLLELTRDFTLKEAGKTFKSLQFLKNKFLQFNFTIFLEIDEIILKRVHGASPNDDLINSNMI